MKKIILILTILISFTLSSCEINEIDRNSPIYDLHEDVIERLYFGGLLNIDENEIFDNKWIEEAFVESYAKFEEDDDFEMYIHIKYEGKFVVNDEWYYVQVLGGGFSEVGKRDSFVVNLLLTFDYKHTDKIDKEWS